MATLPHITTNPTLETPSTSDTSIGDNAGANIVPKDSMPSGSDATTQAAPAEPDEKPGDSVEELAEKVFASRGDDDPQGRDESTANSASTS